ncbi:MAG: DUF924 family protein [Pseudomonadota bacterium]|nr:DUF924 family protein [Pseudomonadota bacterium]
MFEKILKFWFVDINSDAWFKKDESFDRIIREKFGKIHEDACVGKIDGWKNESRSCLALIITLDQFSRNLFRNDAKAFAQDSKAVELTNHVLSKDYLRTYTNDERLFALLPLIHSESIINHELASQLREKFLKNHPRHEHIKRFWDDHKIPVENFGRYPHRNDARGWQSTEAELAFLSKPNSSW